MKQFAEFHKNIKKSKMGVFYVSLLSVLCVLPSFAATNPQIVKLMNEKNQKMGELEQCAKKVTGFKIAGISTLGLTAVGVGGNIALASKNKSLNKEISSTQDAIEKEEKKLASIEADIAKQKAANQKKLVGDVGEGGGPLPEVGADCSWDDQNDNWMLYGVYVRAGTQTETIGERWCTQNGVETPCVCSATKCLDGAREVDLSGIKVCQVDVNLLQERGRVASRVCTQSDKNDKLMVKGFYKQVGGVTGMGGDMVCVNGDNKPVVCTCSATQCVDGTTEITLNGGVIACQTGGASKNTRILGQPCSVEDIAKTFSGSEANFSEISLRADGVLKTKYSSGGEGYFKCFANSKSTKQQNCYCEIESCATDFAKFGGMCVADPKIEGRTIGAPCSRDDILRTNSMLAAKWDADAEKTRSAKYYPTTNYGMVCSDGNGNAEYCMCAADRDACTDGAQLIYADGGLPICKFHGTPIRLAAAPIKTLDTPSIPANLPNIEKHQEVDVCERVTEEGTCGLCGGSWIFDPLKKVGSCYGASSSYNTGKSNGLSLAPANDTKTWKERRQERRQGRQDARDAKKTAEEQRRREESEKLDRELKEIDEILQADNPDRFL